MIYDRLGQQIVPGSLMLRIETGALYVALRVWRDSSFVVIQQRHVESAFRVRLSVGLPQIGDEGEWLRMVEVIRYVELF